MRRISARRHAWAPQCINFNIAIIIAVVVDILHNFVKTLKF